MSSGVDTSATMDVMLLGPCLGVHIATAWKVRKGGAPCVGRMSARWRLCVEWCGHQRDNGCDASGSVLGCAQATAWQRVAKAGVTMQWMGSL